MKEELIKYVMAQADKCYADDFPINNIENWIREFFDSYQPERSKREDYKVTTINSFECPKIEMPIDKDILIKYKWDSIDAVL